MPRSCALFHMSYFYAESLDTPDGVPSPLLRNLVLFGRLLRSLGMPIASRQLVDIAAALDFIDINSREDFRNTVRSLLVRRRDDLPIFDRAFDLFWRSQKSLSDPPLPLAIRDLSKPAPEIDGSNPINAPPHSRKQLARLGSLTADTPKDENEETEESPLPLYSAGEILRDKDFARLNQDELADAKRFLGEMRWSLARRRSRRLRPTPSGKTLDVRGSIRRNLRHGGELLDLTYRGHRMKRRQIVLLCDISGSMDRYTRLLLHFLHSIESSIHRSEVFVFGTRLTRITPDLRRRDADTAIAHVSEHVHDWAGGTRIGEALGTFNRQWARRVQSQGAIVIIISDGWDRGDPQLLSREMQRLQRGSYRLIWLTPLLGSPDYRPLTLGIRAALPWVDDFLPVHNLASLEALGAILNDVQDTRPVRRQGQHMRATDHNGES